MAEVWSARNELLGRDVAIKFLLPSLARNREAVERFVCEARATGRLRHPSIVDVFDAGQAQDGRPFLVMERLEGESLEARLARERRLSPVLACAWIAQVARGLEAAHRSNIVHRDLSSANVFLAELPDVVQPVPKILDFGVSKLIGPAADGRVRTLDGAVMGSPSYMSPEQVQGAETADQRSDVWSLGVLLYECMTGRPPFSAPGHTALLVSIVLTEHAPIAEALPGLDGELAALVEGCLVKDRERRVQSARQVAETLERIACRLAARPIAAGRRATDRISLFDATLPAPPVALRSAFGSVELEYPARRTRGRGVLAAVAIAIASAGVGVALGVGVLGASRDRVVMGIVSPEPYAERASERHIGPEVVPAEVAPAIAETDLVRATARGLGLRLPRRASAPEPIEAGLARVLQARPPRENPY